MTFKTKTMQPSDRAFDHYVNLIYEALETPTAWRALYDQLCEAVDTDSVHVLGFDKRHETLSYSDGANLQVRGELAYMQKYRLLDPRVPIVLSKPLYEWVHCQDYIDESFVANDAFYQEFLLPLDRRYMSACKILDNTDSTIIFSTIRSPERGPLPAESVAFLDRLIPHLSRAFRMNAKNFIYSTQALVGHTLVNKLRQPVILMATTGEVIKTNEAADRLLNTTSVISLRDGKLILPGSHQKELLKKCAEMEAGIKQNEDGVQRSANQFHSMQIKSRGEPGSGEETLYAFFTMLVPHELMGTFGLRPIVMIFLYHPASAPAIDPDLLYAVFGLTPAECKVATMLAEGMALKQIALANGTQHETVRKQLHSIYQKTSTNRQPELISLLLQLPHNVLQD